jgi:nitrogen fixation protein NifU and related proteins
MLMATEDLSREIILDHYQNPRNHGRLEVPTVANRGHNPLCGDEIELSLAIDDDLVSDVRFAGRGCSISQASASMMTEVIKGHTLDEAESAVRSFTQAMANRNAAQGELQTELDALQGVKRYPARVKCALLPWTTLRESIDLYRHREPTHDGIDGLVENCSDSP